MSGITNTEGNLSSAPTYFDSIVSTNDIHKHETPENISPGSEINVKTKHTITNPFNENLKEKLGYPILTPDIFHSAKKSDEKIFKWTIDETSKMEPVDIDEKFHYEEIVDEETELDYQQSINNYFHNFHKLDTPWDSKLPYNWNHYQEIMKISKHKQAIESPSYDDVSMLSPMSATDSNENRMAKRALFDHSDDERRSSLSEISSPFSEKRSDFDFATPSSSSFRVFTPSKRNFSPTDISPIVCGSDSAAETLSIFQAKKRKMEFSDSAHPYSDEHLTDHELSDSLIEQTPADSNRIPKNYTMNMSTDSTGNNDSSVETAMTSFNDESNTGLPVWNMNMSVDDGDKFIEPPLPTTSITNCNFTEFHDTGYCTNASSDTFSQSNNSNRHSNEDDSWNRKNDNEIIASTPTR